MCLWQSTCNERPRRLYEFLYSKFSINVFDLKIIILIEMRLMNLSLCVTVCEIYLKKKSYAQQGCIYLIKKYDKQ